MQETIQDLRYAIRTLARNPVFAAVTVLTLALGIGANTAVFSVINTVLLRPLPYDEPDRLALVWTNFGPDLPQNWISGPEYAEMQEFNTTFESLGLAIPFNVTVTGNGEPVQVSGGAVSGNFFDVMRTGPQVGRLIGMGDDQPGVAPVIVLSDGFWRRRYGADPSIVGQTIMVNAQAYEVIGILQPEFEILHPDAGFPARIDVWGAILPLFGTFFGRPVDYPTLPRGNHSFRGIGRLKPGITIAQAQADMDAVAVSMQEVAGGAYDFEGWGLAVYSMHDDLVEEVRAALLVLLGAVGFVLLIACVNVANLMLARSAAREREIALRTALGAGRRRLLKQLLTESVVLGVAGGALGLVFAFAGLEGLVALAPDDLPRRDAIGVDPIVLAFTFGVSVFTGLLFGLLPAFKSLQTDLTGSLKEGGSNATSGLRGRGIRSTLVVAEVAGAVVLLVGAGLMLRSFQHLVDTEPGYDTGGLITMQVPLPFPKYPGQTAIAFWDRLIEETTALPGVTSAGTISHLPLSSSYQSGTTVVERSETLAQNQRAFEADLRRVSPGYFATMGSDLIAGRFFTDADRAGAVEVAIVDEEFVRRAWPSEDPIGQRVSFQRNADGGMLWREVVGVVRHQKHYGLNTIGREQVYTTYAQVSATTMFLVAQTVGDPIALTNTIRNLIRTIDPDQPIADIASMDGRVRQAVAEPRFNLTLLGAFAGVALVLATVGIYGVISYSVSQRSHEIGVRMALGAEARDVIGMVWKQGFGLVVFGLGIGTLAALGLTRAIRGLLFEVSATDPITYVAVGSLLAIVGATACLFPARRASRVGPVSVLTVE